MGLLYLFRHGETDLTQGCYCGSSDPPLSAQGQVQAARIGEFLRDKRIAAIYASPLLRAVQTAEPSAAALALEIRTVEAVREVDFGEWEELSFAEVRERYREQWRRREADLYAVAPPGGESYRDLFARVVPAFHDLLARHADEMIAVFGHKSVNRIFLASALNMPVAHYRRIGQDPGAVNMISAHDGRIEILTINERCHFGVSAGDAARGVNESSAARGRGIG